MAAVTYPREPSRRGGYRVGSWWGRAFLRAVEEAAYDDAQLTAARALARSGRIGGLVVDVGSFAAAVDDRGGLWTVTGTVPTLDREAIRAFHEVVAAGIDESDPRVEALLAGELPHDLAEHAEEAGVELVPYGGELAAACTCASWQDVCVHALAVLHQLGWLVDRDAIALLHLRGLTREELIARRRTSEAGVAGTAAGVEVGDLVDEVEVAFDAALRARRLLDGDGGGGESPLTSSP